MANTIQPKVIRKSLDDALGLVTDALALARTKQIEDVLYDTANYLWKQREWCDSETGLRPTATHSRSMA